MAKWSATKTDEEEDDGEIIIVAFPVCSENPSFNPRPTQEQMTLLTNLLGNPSQFFKFVVCWL
jgi:hypothetical protein